MEANVNSSQGLVGCDRMTLENGNFKVQSVSNQFKAATPYIRRDFYKITLFSGKVRLHYADTGVLIDRPALIFSNPLVPYSWEPISDHWTGYYCQFTEAFMNIHERSQLSFQDSPLFKIGTVPVCFLNDTQYATVETLFKKMIEEEASAYIHRFDVIKNYVNLVIHEALRIQPVAPVSRQTSAAVRITMSFLELLERQFPITAPSRTLELKTAGDYAKSLAVHVNHLNHAVRDVTGKATTVHIRERIIAEAKLLLRNTDWSIADIAYALGFDYPAYFNNFFKKQTGMTPRSAKLLAAGSI
ncbi:helix-turn-helix domain-containing protein [Chitinophaga rhizophila]|uniref:Helix-turn-helix domain-containing protein n=1 Tax=Chitinophaga rhizophila TaxID=2866212 RepID=A0ABS7GK21_9BACT|nr:helix-turn-helix domain-containing protein [Chitinophaga rhizophila]MBW8687002.1 helix-turn-helix domain-containing protein [Chitinophaga rhizophila]